MSTTETAIIPAYRNSPVTPVPVRSSILRPAPARGGASFADWRGQARTEELQAVPRVSTPAKPTGSRWARHLRSAVIGVTLAAALLTGLQLYAAAGIADARQAALAGQARTAAPQPEQAEQAAPQHGEAPAAHSDWALEGTTTAAPSPLDLPRCTASPDTPLPCLATISPDSKRAVVLEEDASLTALVRR